MIAPLLVAVFLVPLLSQTLTAKAMVPSESVEVEGWKTVKTDFVTVHFPAGGRKPMFIWWYTKDPENIYVVKFDGLTEHFAFESPYYMQRFEAEGLRLKELIEEEIEHPKGLFNTSKILNLMRLKEVIGDIVEGWGHPAYLPFSAGKWTLKDLQNITASDGKNIGITFTFNLTKVYKERFRFAENNVAITVRFYNKTVEESVMATDGTQASEAYRYTVGPNEMKMDFRVNNWKWNLDLVKPLLQTLKENGVAIPETKTGLALGIHMASINRTEPDEIEEDLESCSTTGKVVIDDRSLTLSKNQSGSEETAMQGTKSLGDQTRVRLTAANTTLSGYFKFIASAIVNDTTGSHKVPVKGTYRSQGSSVKLYLSYPYFHGLLVHDPSIGVEAQETAAPNYQVTISGLQSSVLNVNPIPQILSTQLAIILAVVATAVAFSILVAKSKGRMIVLRSF